MKNPEIFVVMVLYMCIVVGIGVYFYKKSQKNPIFSLADLNEKFFPQKGNDFFEKSLQSSPFMI